MDHHVCFVPGLNVEGTCVRVGHNQKLYLNTHRGGDGDNSTSQRERSSRLPKRFDYIVLQCVTNSSCRWVHEVEE